jgi:hypothetical protein
MAISAYQNRFGWFNPLQQFKKPLAGSWKVGPFFKSMFFVNVLNTTADDVDLGSAVAQFVLQPFPLGFAQHVARFTDEIAGCF